MKKVLHIFLICCTIFIVSCNKDNGEKIPPPTISFDRETPIYTVKVGRTLVISPMVENTGNSAVYTWKRGDNIIGTEKNLSFSSEEEGSIYVRLNVTTPSGSAEKELRIDVLPFFVPAISMAVPDGGFTVLKGEELSFEPEVEYFDNTSFTWQINLQQVSGQKNYTFLKSETGEYNILFTAVNEDGERSIEFTVKVCEEGDMPFEWMFETLTHNVSSGRTIFLRPYWIKNAFNATYSWKVNDGAVVQSGGTSLFGLNTAGLSIGEHKVTVTMNNSHIERSQIITVNVCAVEGTHRRALTGTIEATRGYFFLPAPSQYTNRDDAPGYTQFSTQEQVNEAIRNNPKSTEYGGSLGAYGGYIVVGFDHSVNNGEGYDLEIEGNAFKGSSEPGIVWVMQDENGDGEPNDTWYELKGSEYGKSGYIRDYAVTYFRPLLGQKVAWLDNQGNTGTIDFLHTHTPNTIYPRWLNSDSYTLVGSRLPARTEEVSPGNWTNLDFDWGYADNFSKKDMLLDDDNANPEGNYIGNHFDIGDAVRYDGQPANLSYIDFIKVQTAVNAKAGWFGDLSTEVGKFRDFNLMK